MLLKEEQARGTSIQQQPFEFLRLHSAGPILRSYLQEKLRIMLQEMEWFNKRLHT